MICETGPAPEGWEDYPHPPGSLRYRREGERLYVLGWPQLRMKGQWQGTGPMHKDDIMVPVVVAKASMLGSYWSPRWWWPDMIYDAYQVIERRFKQIDQKRREFERSIEGMHRQLEQWHERHYLEWESDPADHALGSCRIQGSTPCARCYDVLSRHVVEMDVDFYRADGRVICGTCKKEFRDHPWEHVGDGEVALILRRICNGDLVKL